MKAKHYKTDVEAYLGNPVSTRPVGSGWSENQYVNSGMSVEVAYDKAGKIAYWGCRPSKTAPIQVTNPKKGR